MSEDYSARRLAKLPDRELTLILIPQVGAAVRRREQVGRTGGSAHGAGGFSREPPRAVNLDRRPLNRKRRPRPGERLLKARALLDLGGAKNAPELSSSHPNDGEQEDRAAGLAA